MRHLVPLSILFFTCLYAGAQVVTKFSNLPLAGVYPLNNRLVLSVKGTLFVTDGISQPKEIFVGDPASSGSIVASPVTVNQQIYFRLGSSSNIYKTDGTDTGTNYIAGGALPVGILTYTNGQIYFEGSDYGFYKIDIGSLNKTVLIDKGLPVFSSAIAIGNTVYFTADDGINGGGLWKTDGTKAGTVLVKSIPSTRPNYYTDYGFAIYAAIDNKLVFGFRQAYPQNPDLWVSDGTTEGTQKIDNDYPRSGMVIDDRYYYTKPSPTSGNYTSLWVTEGTSSSSYMVSDSINIDVDQSVILNGKNICILNNHGGIPKLAILDTGPESITPFASFYRDRFPIKLFSEKRENFSKNEIFFIASDSVDGTELWITDGTAEHTRMVKDILPGKSSAFDRFSYSSFQGTIHNEFASYYYTADGIYFAANDSIHGMELWKSDGTEEGTKMVKDINPLADNYVSGPESFFGLNDRVFFYAIDSGDLYKSNPSALYVITADSITLPVTLSAFTAKPVKDDAQLTWKTATEINTAYFKVQRSNDGRIFTEISTVKASGNSATPKIYSFTDANALHNTAPVLYYRLQVNDKDGKQSYSNIVTINTIGGSLTATLRPNPSYNFITLNYNMAMAGKASVSIADASGKKVVNKELNAVQGSNQATINIKALAAGIYYVHLATGSGTQNIKFIKQP